MSLTSPVRQSEPGRLAALPLCPEIPQSSHRPREARRMNPSTDAQVNELLRPTASRSQTHDSQDIRWTTFRHRRYDCPCVLVSSAVMKPSRLKRERPPALYTGPQAGQPEVTATRSRQVSLATTRAPRVHDTAVLRSTHSN